MNKIGITKYINVELNPFWNKISLNISLCPLEVNIKYNDISNFIFRLKIMQIV